METILEPVVVTSLPAWTEMPDPRQLLAASDPEMYEAIELERRRQANGVELIASENYVSAPVLAALGSVLTNKYAEGYPNKRYYGGCQYVDVAEEIAIARAKQIFGADHANVQPTPARRPTRRSTWPCSTPATRCSVSSSTTAAT